MPPIEYRADPVTTEAEIIARAKSVRERLRGRSVPTPVERKPQPEVITREVRPYEPPPRPRGFLTRFVGARHATVVAEATAPIATAVVLDEDPEAPPFIVDVRTVLGKAAKLFGFSWVEMRSARRDWPLVRYRQIAMYVAWKKTLASLPVIGRVFGGRDHTTVLHAARLIERLVKTDKEIADAVAGLFESLGAPEDMRGPSVSFLPSLRPATRGSNWGFQELEILRRLYIDQQLSAEETAKHLPGRTTYAIMSKASRIAPGEKS